MLFCLLVLGGKLARVKQASVGIANVILFAGIASK